MSSQENPSTPNVEEHVVIEKHIVIKEKPVVEKEASEPAVKLADKEPTKEDTKEPTKEAEEPAKGEKESKVENSKEVESPQPSDKTDAKEETEEDQLKMEPKRRTAYNYFVTEVQPVVRKENPTVSSHEIAKLVSAKWKALTAEQKQPYEDKAASDRKRVKESEKPAEKTMAESDKDSRYSLRSSMAIKSDEIQSKKRGLESEESDDNKKQRVTSEE